VNYQKRGNVRIDKDHGTLNIRKILKGKYITDKRICYIQINDFFDNQDGRNGALLTFRGIVRRDKTKYGVVKEIIYEAYVEMAEKEIEKIKQNASKNFKADEIHIIHRIGKVSVGEVSLLVAVLAPHRQAGIKAVEYVIEEIKNRVPIWKKEIFEDGSHYWVEGNV
jgi:molybdopterin synthase catalytic subunit